jgi:hypothetical protein
MTCKRIPNGIVCVNPWARFHVGNRYIWMEYHPYGGPTFFTDRNCTQIYEPKVNDPVWPVFTKWHDQHMAAKGKA